jgi:hypothetical protein
MPAKQVTRSDEEAQSISEQIKIATELHADDMKRLAALQERTAATQAAEELGIPAAYMAQAASVLAARQTAKQKRRRRTILSAAVAGAAGFMLAGSWALTHKSPMHPAPLAYTFGTSSQGMWRLAGYAGGPDGQATLSFPVDAGHPVAKIAVKSFAPAVAMDAYDVNLVTNQIPRPLTGFKTVSFRVRGSGLGQIRLFLVNSSERWCSPFLTASGDWHMVHIPLSHFLRQEISRSYNPQDAPYKAPAAIGMISFELGADANPPNAHGDVEIDNLKFQ